MQDIEDLLELKTQYGCGIKSLEMLATGARTESDRHPVWMTIEQLPKFEMFEEGGQITAIDQIRHNRLLSKGTAEEHPSQEFIRFLTLP